MAYDEMLAERVRCALNGKGEISEKKMFGGICFLLRGKMCCGVLKNNLVVRVEPTEAQVLLKKPGVRRMDFTGKSMKNFLYVNRKVLRTTAQLDFWLRRCFSFLILLDHSLKTKGKTYAKLARM